jgi:branched-chain amino acid transport system ATP-binding protein
MTLAGTADRDAGAAVAGVLLRTQGLSKRFGGVHAVRNISLAVPERSIFAIIGPNGAGKSTLLNLLSGIYPADTGAMLFADVDVTRLAAHRRVRHGIGRTFQKIRLFKHLSVLDNVLAGFHIRCDLAAWQYVIHGGAFRHYQARCREEATRLLAFMGLKERAQVLAGALSYGEQRMLEIARALATAPRLLMIDEPAAGLNAAEVETLLQRIQMLRVSGLTVLIVEHNMDLVMQIADRVLVIDYGQYVFEGAPAEVQSHAGVIAAYLGGEIQ